MMWFGRPGERVSTVEDWSPGGPRGAEGEDRVVAGRRGVATALDRGRAGVRKRHRHGARPAALRRAGARPGTSQGRVRDRRGRQRVRDRAHMVTAARTSTGSPTNVAEQAAMAKALRAEVPRSSHGDWEPATKRPDPIALLHEQAESRGQELVRIRYGRMVASPFTFYRGAAYVMASDLAASPQSGIRVQLCGDAHLPNFGGFASPDRELVFDLNAFDETLPGPWEWDVKRLAASIEVAGRARGFKGKQRRRIVRGAVAAYREAMRRFAGMTALDVWYSTIS